MSSLSPELQLLLKVLLPKHNKKREEVLRLENSFVHYTSAATAHSILSNGEFWLRNASAMNDHSEIEHGTSIIDEVFFGEAGKPLWQEVDKCFGGASRTAKDRFENKRDSLLLDTYFVCFSVHQNAEDRRGRLSMWRAYGDTALVLSPKLMTAESKDGLVITRPVIYLDNSGAEGLVAEICRNIKKNAESLKKLGQETFLEMLEKMLLTYAVSTKHPGFEEEQEWRVFYRRSSDQSNQSKMLTEHTEILGGLPQQVFKLSVPKASDQSNENNVGRFVERIIIGPNRHPQIAKQAFEKAVQNSAPLPVVTVSDIPLRVG